jgi:hypothetical protein
MKHPPSRSGVREIFLIRRLALVIGMAVMAFALVADAAETPSAPPAAGPAAPSLPADDPAVQASIAGCAAWTDRCVTCEREDGKISCSNPGIACQPQALTCLRPAPADGRAGNP